MQLPALWREMKALYFGGANTLKSAEFSDDIRISPGFSGLPPPYSPIVMGFPEYLERICIVLRLLQAPIAFE